MTLSNLVSGLIGAVVGGLFSIVATVMTFRHERSQVRQSASHTACNAIVENILTIHTAMGDVQWAMDHNNGSPDSSIYSLFETVRSATQRILYVYNVLIANETLRSRISEFIQMVDVWYRDAQKSPTAVNQKRIEAIEAYIEYVTDSIQAHLSNRRLPPDKSPPDMLATEKA